MSIGQDLSPVRHAVVLGPSAQAVAALLAGLPAWRDVQVAVIETPQGGAAMPLVVARLAGADLVLAATGCAAGLSADVRALALTAGAVGCPPAALLVVDADQDPAAAARIGMQWAAFCARLGRRAPAVLALPREADRLPALLAAGRAGETDDAPARLWIGSLGAATEGVVPLTGRLLAGRVAPGDRLVALPSARQVTVRSVQGDPAQPGRMNLVVETTQALAAGELLAAAGHRPELADQVAAEIVWTGAKPMLPGRPYMLHLGPQQVTVQISALKHRIDPEDLEAVAARRLEAGDVGVCNLSFAAPIVFEPEGPAPELARFELRDALDGGSVGRGRIVFTLRRATNIHWQSLAVDKAERARLKAQRPCCLWFTGLSGSGKSTVASLLEKRLAAQGRHTYTLDGDNVRHGLNRDLGFTDADRVENIRRVAEVAKLFVDAGLIVMVSFISPFRAERRMARDLLPEAEFIEIFVDTPLEICEQRDVKGLYKKARAGQLKNFTGLDSPYEAPERPDVHLAAGSMTAEGLVEVVFGELARRGIV